MPFTTPNKYILRLQTAFSGWSCPYVCVCTQECVCVCVWTIWGNRWILLNKNSDHQNWYIGVKSSKAIVSLSNFVRSCPNSLQEKPTFESLCHGRPNKHYIFKLTHFFPWKINFHTHKDTKQSTKEQFQHVRNKTMAILLLKRNKFICKACTVTILTR